MHQPDPQLRAGPQQPGIDESRPVVYVNPGGHPAGGQCGFEGCGQPDGVFGEPEPVPDHQSAVIVEEGEQVSLAVPDPRAVQGVANPQVVGINGFEPAEHLADLTSGRAHQLTAVEVAQQGRLRRRPPGSGAQDPGHLRGGAGRVLPFQRGGQLQHLHIGAGGQPPRFGHQRLEPTGPVAADPTIQGGPRDLHLGAERIDMAAPGDLADHPAALPGRQTGIQRRADQLIAEQPDRLGPLLTLVFLQRHRGVLLARRPCPKPLPHRCLGEDRRSPHPASGATGVATRQRSGRRPPRRQQPPTADRHHHLSRRQPAQQPHRPEPPADRLDHAPHRGHHIAPRAPQPIRDHHVDTRSHRHAHTPRPDRLQPSPGPAKPAPHRRRWHPQIDRDPPMPSTPGTGSQRHPDLLGAISSTQQQRDRQQHLGDQTGTATGPPRTHRITESLDPTGPGETPPGQHSIPTRRTPQLPGHQPGLDANRINLYRHHQCLRALQRGTPPSRPRLQRGAAHPSVPHHTDGAHEPDQPGPHPAPPHRHPQ